MSYLADLQKKEDAEASARALGYEWLTTSPNPRVTSGSADAGQRGWRCHAVKATSETKLQDIAREHAACGLLPAHGWDVDLFITRYCARCVAAIAKIRAQA